MALSPSLVFDFPTLRPGSRAQGRVVSGQPLDGGSKRRRVAPVFRRRAALSCAQPPRSMEEHLVTESLSM